MGFYGRISSLKNTHFQFDNRFTSRSAMDMACLQGKDNVFSGRFVLVSYSEDDKFYPGNILLGFKNGTDNKIYSDIECTKPFIFTSFNKVTSPVQSNWNKYYISDGYSYVSLPSKDVFSTEETEYYIPSLLANLDEENPNAENDTTYVGTGQIVQIYNMQDGYPMTSFYKCNNSIDSTSGIAATWELLTNNNDYPLYIKNYNIDKNYYGNSFDPRGYDATVWEKTYSKGFGKFILVARLNSAYFPAIDLKNDPPSLMPQAPYIDTWRSDAMYQIHVPTHPGLQLKPAPEKRDLLENGTYSDPYYPLSDVDKIDSIIEEKNPYYPEIYLNLGGSQHLNNQEYYHMVEQRKDIETKNNITLTLTGETGINYTDKNGVIESKPDLLELGIHLPIIGNIIDSFYDIIYGVTSNTDKTRPRDISWYDGKESDELKQQGSGALNYKQYDLNTIAGTLNTMHSQLGQIIYTWERLPETSQLASYDKDKIYYVPSEKKYYRIGTAYDYIDPAIKLKGNPYRYEAAPEVDINTYITNTYYEDAAGLQIANGEFEPGKTYYKKCLAPLAYELIHSPDPNSDDYKIGLKKYEQGKYFLHSPTEPTYYRDNNPEPTDVNRIYYQMAEPDLNVPNPESTADIDLIEISSFSTEYKPNTYYIQDVNDNFIKATEDLPNPSEKYYTPVMTPYITPAVEVVFYQPNLFYYLEPTGNGDPIPHLSTFETLAEARVYIRQKGWYTVNDNNVNIYFYWLEFDKNPILTQTIIDGEVHIQNAYELIATHGIINIVEETEENKNKLYYHDEDTDNYIAYKNISQVGDGHETPLWAIPRIYQKLERKSELTNLYLPGKYWMFDNNDSRNYIICNLALSDLRNTEWTYVYLIKHSFEIAERFYVKDTYYYESSHNVYELDSNDMNMNRKYYIKQRLYVDTDSSGRCPHGYEWNNYALFVPASIDLKMREEYPYPYEIKDFTNDNFSINRYLLTLCNMLLEGDNNTRDIKTLQGALNNYKDFIYGIGRLLPNKLLFVNSFGQISSSSIDYLDLLQIDWAKLLEDYSKS